MQTPISLGIPGQAGILGAPAGELRRRLTHTSTVVHTPDGALALSTASGREVLALQDADH